ncbi:MAG: manganese efflux pump MntP family protein [Hespellia sp.]|nr:manganese efflux pump MntP family protein [Hespellia sp.]
MGIIEILLLAVGLSMDAFAVSICKGLAMPKINFKNAAICGVWFGGFQALMPMIGYLLGAQFAHYITAITPWIAFVLLLLIGGNMIREAMGKCDCEEEADPKLDVKTMFIMAVATSIDALAIGVTFAMVPVRVSAVWSTFGNTVLAVLVIGITTFLISCIGVKVGNVFGTKYERRAELAGGMILVCLGLKILLGSFF